MKISGPNDEFHPVWDLRAAVRSVPSNQISEPVSSAPTDRTQLANLSSYLTSALSGSAAHVAKLANLAAAVSSGQYQIDSYAVSGSIIEHGIQFGGSAYWALGT